jgi:hypothetical protein
MTPVVARLEASITKLMPIVDQRFEVSAEAEDAAT